LAAKVSEEFQHSRAYVHYHGNVGSIWDPNQRDHIAYNTYMTVCLAAVDFDF